MQNFLWRIVYALVGLFVFWLIMPLFLKVIGLPVPADAMLLVRYLVACLALVYVIYPSTPPRPFW